MTDLASDTEVLANGDGWTATVSEDWMVWFPNGGYLAAIALRAAARQAPSMVPASLTCHFLTAARVGPADLSVRTLRASSRAQSLSVCMTQDGSVVLEALIWLVAPGIDGFPRRSRPAPPAAPPAGLRSLDGLTPPGVWDWCRLWKRLEVRPLDELERYAAWPNETLAEPTFRSWLRFRPPLTSDQPVVDAGRSLVTIDVFPYIAALMIYGPGQLTHYAPTLSLSVSFHSHKPASAWLLMEASSSFSGGGLLAGEVAMWAEDRELVATGITQMLCRPRIR
ncbi:MAG TPA: thioesterase family protein [Streptosporangiaceae bacterium]|nr:thioesterase family protein [Streptosporangiaceae bacterium]